jgi:alkylation response protein AidB-like acyl-CoA dehydrogenase
VPCRVTMVEVAIGFGIAAIGKAIDYQAAKKKEERMERYAEEQRVARQELAELTKAEATRQKRQQARISKSSMLRQMGAARSIDTESQTASAATTGVESSLKGALDYLSSTSAAQSRISDAELEYTKASYATPGLASTLLSSGFELGGGLTMEYGISKL